MYVYSVAILAQGTGLSSPLIGGGSSVLEPIVYDSPHFVAVRMALGAIAPQRAAWRLDDLCFRPEEAAHLSQPAGRGLVTVCKGLR